MYKKITLLIFAFIIIIGIVGCSGKGTSLENLSQAEISDTIFQPALSAGILSSSWSSPDELNPEQLLSYYSHTNHQDNSSKNIENVLGERFGVQPSFLRESKFYDADSKSYNLTDLPSYPYIGSVTKIEKGNTYKISFEYEDEQGGEFKGVFETTEGTLEDFIFIKCQVKQVAQAVVVEPVEPDEEVVSSPIDDDLPEDLSTGDEEPYNPPSNETPPITYEGELPEPDPNAPLGSKENPIAEEPIAD